MAKIPIWTYWENPPGTKRPTYLDLCIDTMKQYCNRNPFKLQLLGPQDLSKLLPNLRPDFDKIHCDKSPAEDIATKIDYVRVKLLEKYGGIWIDIDTLVMDYFDHLLPIYNTYDFASRTNEDRLSAVNFMMTKRGGKIISEYSKAQDRLISKNYFIKWAQIGAFMLTSITKKHSSIYRDLGIIGSIPYKYNQRFFSTNNPNNFINNGTFCFQLYNKVFASKLKDLSREEVLSKDWLMSKLFKIALHL